MIDMGFERKKKEDFKEEDFLTKKLKAIKESKMPEEQKKAMLKELGVLCEAKKEGVPFSVFAKIKKIPKTMHKAMQLYPKAKNVSLASLQEWESIFKDF
jgi:hypothetical protein